MMTTKSKRMREHADSGGIMAEFFVALFGGIWFVVALLAFTGVSPSE